MDVVYVSESLGASRYHPKKQTNKQTKQTPYLDDGSDEVGDE